MRTAVVYYTIPNYEQVYGYNDSEQIIKTHQQGRWRRWWMRPAERSFQLASIELQRQTNRYEFIYISKNRQSFWISWT